MNITIQTPYAQADRYTGIWANEEERINFRKEPDRALRCTISLCSYAIKRVSIKDSVSRLHHLFESNSGGHGCFVKPRQNQRGRDDEYHLIPLAGRRAFASRAALAGVFCTASTNFLSSRAGAGTIPRMAAKSRLLSATPSSFQKGLWCSSQPWNFPAASTSRNPTPTRRGLS